MLCENGIQTIMHVPLFNLHSIQLLTVQSVLYLSISSKSVRTHPGWQFIIASNAALSSSLGDLRVAELKLLFQDSRH